MAEEADDRSILDVILAKFTRSLPLRCVKICKFDKKSKFIALVRDRGEICLLSLKDLLFSVCKLNSTAEVKR